MFQISTIPWARANWNSFRTPIATKLREIKFAELRHSSRRSVHNIAIVSRSISARITMIVFVIMYRRWRLVLRIGTISVETYQFFYYQDFTWNQTPPNSDIISLGASPKVWKFTRFFCHWDVTWNQKYVFLCKILFKRNKKSLTCSCCNCKRKGLKI